MAGPLSSRRIASFEVQSLFGLYNHRCDLNLVERVTILHGPNGVGKSALLRLLNAFFCGRYAEFAYASFRRFSITFTDNTCFEVDGRESVELSQVPDMALRLRHADGSVQAFQIQFSNNFERVAAQIERDSPFVGRLAPAQWYDYRSSQTMSAEEVVTRYGSETDLISSIAMDPGAEPDALRKVRASLSVHLIETQRLLRQEQNPRAERKTNLMSTVRSYSVDLQQEIAEVLSHYGNESQRLDQTFPNRLITRDSPVVELAQLKESLEKLDQRYTSLNKLGLLQKVSYPASPAQIDALDDVRRSVMALYVDDMGRKLRVFDDLAQRVRLLLQAVNSKFRNKQITVSREDGITVVDSKGRTLRLEALSSGEQHELVLWYDLLFKVKPRSLVLIDEPELSLHVSWQKSFLPELLDVTQAAGIDVVLATHSPMIVGDRIDLMVALDAEPDV